MRIYSDLAPWFHLLTAPGDYADEAAFYTALIREACPNASTMLELGSGGGNNASFMKSNFTCTLTDLSADMLAVSRTLNPECEHLQGDMRTLRLDRTFDAVFVHDAVVYMLTEDDLGAAIQTAFMHTRPRGAALFLPDAVEEIYQDGTSSGGHDGNDGRALRYFEWTRRRDANSYHVDYAVMLLEPGQPVRVEHDHHVEGLFPRATWHRLFQEAGFEPLSTSIPDPFEGEHVVFVVRRPA